MDKEDIKELIARKERQIKDLQRLKALMSDKHFEKQIDILLGDLSRLYKEIND